MAEIIRRMSGIGGFAGAIVLFAAVTAGAASGKISGSVTILAVNDTHGRIMPLPVGPEDPIAQDVPGEENAGGEIGGFARLVTAVDAIRHERSGDNVILLHAGDAFSDDLLGNLTRGEAMIRLMNALDFKFMAFGNHDFDYGLERTRELEKLAEFPIRGANVIDEKTGESLFGEPYRVIEAGGLRVGLLALGYHNTALTTSRDNVEGVKFVDGVEQARKWLPELRKISDVVIVLSHQGTEMDRVLAREVPGIDLIVGGHSHELLTPDPAANEVPILQSLSEGVSFGEAVITVANGRVTEVRGVNHFLRGADFNEDPHFLEQIDALRRPHRERLEEVIAEAAAAIPRRYKEESPFDVLAGAILRQETGAEIALLPGVGYGVALQPGPVTREMLYNLLPHDQTLVTLSLTGRQIRDILEQSAENQRPENPADQVGGLVQTAGMRWRVDLRQPVGKRIDNVMIGGRPLEPQRRYQVVTHSGMLEGMHRYGTFARGEDLRPGKQQINVLIEEALRRRGRLEAPPMGQVTVVRE